MTECSRCETPVAPEDLRCVICGLGTPGNHAATERAFAEVLRCDGCGAAVSYKVAAKAPACAFCGDVMHLEKPADPMEEADGYLPFAVSTAEAQRALGNWLGSLGFFRPSDLRSTSRIEELTPLYWVGWLCDAEARVCWTADSNAGAARSYWAPHAGQHTVDYDNLVVPATRGLTYNETERLTSHYHVGTTLPEPASEPRATVERFDVQRSAAREQVLSALRITSMNRAESWVPGTKVRNLSVAVRLRKLETLRLAFPAYVMAYRYRDELYRAIVHGQDARCTFGKAPISWRKVLGVAAACIAALGILAWLLSNR